MSYYKRVAYIDYYEDGTKLANAGFVKLIQWRRSTNTGIMPENPEFAGEVTTCLQIYISNFPREGEFQKNVDLQAGEREVLLGTVRIKERRAVLQIKCLEEVLGNTEILKEDEDMLLKVEIAPNKRLVCVLNEKKNRSELSAAEEVTSAAAGPIQVMEEKTPVAGEKYPVAGEKYPVVEEACPAAKGASPIVGQMNRVTADRAMQDGKYEAGQITQARKINAEANMESENTRGEQWSGTQRNGSREQLPKGKNEMMRVQRDKWRQLVDILPHICPFEDKREYLQIELKDLVVLSKLYYRLVENSFLLHGYYNYGHLIMTKMYRKGAERVYVGVPGNYYDKEAQVAVLFGFETFESAMEPAKDGDFGYYMIGVEI